MTNGTRRWQRHPDGVCVIAGCGKAHRARGWCSMHYQRWSKWGDPLAPNPHERAKRHEEAATYLLAVLDGVPTECTTWPYVKTRDGYGRIRWEGRRIGVHQLVCEWYHGECPPGLQCCHSCGNGARGCFTPSHLRWDTPAANARDLIRHRSERRGQY